jgi:hypothetical protein
MRLEVPMKRNLHWASRNDLIYYLMLWWSGQIAS